VVIVDDHPLFLQAVQRVLEDADRVEVVGTALDGPAGLAAVCSLRPDLLILDLVLSRSSGLDVLQQVRACCPDLKVLILSDYISAAHEQMLDQLGVQGYAPKTVFGTELVAAVLAVAAGRTVRVGQAVGAADTPETEPLTPREYEVLRLVAEGLHNQEIADALVVSSKTIEEHVTHLLRKLGARSRTEAIRKAQLHGLL
jgi:DNA-binding NarL/FixJ family response regulator